MKFTIYSGFFNNLHHFENVWNGIKNQTYDNWEWVISDDFSDNQDDAKFLEDFANSTPKVIYIKPRWKREFFFNPPVEISTGDIMVVQDVDDYPHPKLLEVYKFNYEKFPGVEMISCSSMIRNYNITGELAWYKTNHYKGVYNLRQAMDIMYRYLGDARSYRIKQRVSNEFVSQNQFKYSFTDENIKAYIIEKRGKLLFIPRILHTYTQYSDSSISFKKITTEELNLIRNENDEFFNQIDSSINIDELDSIEHYYDDCYETWCVMLFSDHYKLSQRLNFDIHSSELTPRSRTRIKELYFDHNIKFLQFNEDVDYVFFKISVEDDLLYLEKNLPFYYERQKKVTIFCDNQLKNQVGGVIKFAHFWHDFSGVRNFTLFHNF
jgi:hypothetical protein